MLHYCCALYIRLIILSIHVYRGRRTVYNNNEVTLLDTRTVGEFVRGYVEGFKNIPVDELRERLPELDKSKTVYVICQSGLRSYIACRILEGNGFESLPCGIDGRG